MVVSDASEAPSGRLQRRRLFVVLGATAVWALLLAARLVHLQVMLHEELLARARDQQLQTVEIPAERGDIFDRQGRLLASSIDETSVYVHPHLLADADAAAAALAPALQVPVERLRRKFHSDARFWYLSRKAKPEVVEALRRVVAEHDLHQSVGFVEESQRYYPNRSLAAQVLGFVDVDNVGQAGVEYTYDDLIRGQPGSFIAVRDGGNRRLDPDGSRRTEPTLGHDLTLTIDAVIQAAAEQALARTVRERQADGGTAVVMDPRTGAILAMASYPGFNPNVRDAAFERHWKNGAVLHAYEPGSTFKIFTAAAAVETGLVDEEELIDCEGGALRVANHTYNDWKRGFGIMPFRDVLVNSSNVGMIKVGLRFEADAFHAWLRRFGFGEPTGVDLPGEAPGILRTPDGWSRLSQSSMVIGQEIGVTPLQLVTAVAAVANRGVLMEPYVVARVDDADGRTVQERQPRARRRVIGTATAQRLIDTLEGVVRGSRGAGTAASIPGYRIAGKTGTAQKIGPDGRYGLYVSSFVGMVPASEPRFVALVVIDSPRRGYYGSEVAMPVFRAIAEKAIHALRIRPDDANEPAPLTIAGGLSE